MEIGSTAWYAVMLLAGVAVGAIVAMARVVLGRRDRP